MLNISEKRAKKAYLKYLKIHLSAGYMKTLKDLEDEMDKDLEVLTEREKELYGFDEEEHFEMLDTMGEILEIMHDKRVNSLRDNVEELPTKVEKGGIYKYVFSEDALAIYFYVQEVGEKNVKLLLTTPYWELLGIRGIKCDSLGLLSRDSCGVSDSELEMPAQFILDHCFYCGSLSEEERKAVDKFLAGTEDELVTERLISPTKYSDKFMELEHRRIKTTIKNMC